jgi:hypothetical protein
MHGTVLVLVLTAIDVSRLLTMEFLLMLLFPKPSMIEAGIPESTV